jgi:hypothetical protein
MKRLLPLVLAGAVLAGCGSAGTGSASPASVPTTPTAPATEPVPTAPAATKAPTNPVVRFTITTNGTHPVGVWPFTARLASITENPNGFPASQPMPPQDTYLMVQVNITSGITGRAVAVNPEPVIQCHAPGDQDWSYKGGDGYDQGTETEPEAEGANIAFGDGQPYLWDAEWQVPEGTSTTNVKCILEGVTHYPSWSGNIAGSGKLN